MTLESDSFEALRGRISERRLPGSVLRIEQPSLHIREGWREYLSEVEIEDDQSEYEERCECIRTFLETFDAEVEDDRSEYEQRRERIGKFLDAFDSKVTDEMVWSDWYEEPADHGAFDWDC